MNDRYAGAEPCISPNQVVRYLVSNYTDTDGTAMPRAVARDIVQAGSAKISRGILVYQSNVEYLGDEALQDSGREGWAYIPDPDDDMDEDDA
jgi:hypothetical protein